MKATPVFAVVGHPNKGKSSIVSTLAHDDSVAVGPLPGTTVRCRRYPMTVDGRTLYILIDTPGFQRARKAFAWLRSRGETAADHPGAVRAFVREHGGDPAFRNECELLAPILDGAGILYVVDGSVPYGREYEAEMEILRWTGQPRMALINPIGRSDHVEEWRTALGQYFGVVRVFDALMAGFEKQVELLRAFGELREEWKAPLDEAVEILSAERTRRRAGAARGVAETITEMLTLRIEARLDTATPREAQERVLEERYRERLRTLEAECRERVEGLYAHHAVRRIEPQLEGLGTESLFSRDTWKIFGLKRSQVIGFGALGGGAAGGWLDLAVGGSSFFLGALFGAGIGAVTAALAAETLVEVKVLNIPLGGRMLVAGPTTNVNFPHVVFERARLHHLIISGRTHAERGELDPSQPPGSPAPPLTAEFKRGLEQAFGRIRRGQDAVAATEDLARLTEEIFALDDRGR